MCGETGTNTFVEYPVTPYTNIETGQTVTTAERWDARRPDAAIDGSWAGFALQGATGLANVIWFVICWDMDTAPAGATVRDLGDPESAGWKQADLPLDLRTWLYAAYPDHPAVIAENVRTRADMFRLLRPDDWAASAKRQRFEIEGGG